MLQTCIWYFKFIYFPELEIPVNFSSCLLILLHYLPAFSLLMVDLAFSPGEISDPLAEQ